MFLCAVVICSLYSLAAVGFSLEEMSVLISTYVKKWQYKDILNDIDNLAWEDLSEEWCACLKGVKALPCEIRLSPPRLPRDEGDELVKVGLSAKSGVNSESPEQVWAFRGTERCKEGSCCALKFSVKVSRMLPCYA